MEVALLIPALVGVAVALRVKSPLLAGLQSQTAIMLGEVPEVKRLLQPAILLPFNLNETLDGTVTFAVI